MEIYNDDVNNEGEFVKLKADVDLDASVKSPGDCEIENVNSYRISFKETEKFILKKSCELGSSAVLDIGPTIRDCDVKTGYTEDEDKIIFKFDLSILDKIKEFLVSTDKAIDKESVEKEILDFSNTLITLRGYREILSEDELNKIKDNFKKESWDKYRTDIIDSFTKIFWFGYFILGLQPNEIVDMVEEHYNK